MISKEMFLRAIKMREYGHKRSKKFPVHEKEKKVKPLSLN